MKSQDVSHKIQNLKNKVFLFFYFLFFTQNTLYTYFFTEFRMILCHRFQLSLLNQSRLWQSWRSQQPMGEG